MPTILVTDDDEASRYASQRILERAGFEVVLAKNGAETLARAREGPDLVLLDIQLPDMSGVEVCRRLKADHNTSAIPILHHTATYGAAEQQAAALESGADAYLTVPVEPIVLVATVRALLRAREAENVARRATAWWQSTFDAIGDGVSLLDRDGRLVRCNRAYAALFGKEPESLIGEAATPSLPGADAPVEGWPSERALRERVRAKSEIASGGRWFEVVADPVLDDVGEVVAIVRTVKDISERKAAAERMNALLAGEQAARKEAEQINRLKDEFLATLSHELRTPLNAIVGWTQVLREGGLDATSARRAIETIARNAQVQSRLISDILDVSRIVAGNLRLDLRQLDLLDVIREAVETVSPAAQAKGIRLETRLDPDAAVINADTNRLQQVVWNLLSNAIKFAPTDGHVLVRLEPVTAGVQLTVEDDGPGIDPAFLPYVFDRFRQADASSTRPHRGLGLGLAIVRHLVEMHGGTVSAQNRAVGTGAILTVTLPRRAVVANPPPAAGVAEPPTPMPPDEPSWLTEAPSLEDTAVLVVDDDLDARTLVRYVLERCGASVTVTASAAEALQALTEAPPDVLLADIEMPGEDGYSLIQRVRALAPDSGGAVPAAALTAYAGPEDRSRALTAGFQAHVVKPIEPRRLAEVVSTLRRRGPVTA
jgi:PAS domain S-box-containing protein